MGPRHFRPHVGLASGRRLAMPGFFVGGFDCRQRAFCLLAPLLTGCGFWNFRQHQDHEAKYISMDKPDALSGRLGARLVYSCVSADIDILQQYVAISSTHICSFSVVVI